MQAALDRLAASCLAQPVKRTERLILRPWQEADREPFASINADAEVMAHFPSTLSREQSDSRVAAFRLHAARSGFGMWAVQDRASNTFIGTVGLSVANLGAEFTPAVEISWRLARAWWGMGLATEAAREALAYGLDTLGLPAVMSWTVPANVRSWRLMERLGMVHVGSFNHPSLPLGHPLSEHVRYAIERANPEAPSVLKSVATSDLAVATEGNEGARTAPIVLPRVWIDGDGCPRVVKEIVWKAAHRGTITVTMVANRAILVPRSTRIRTVVVAKGMDVADDWLVAHAGRDELVITSDVPLAAELVPRGVQVLSPRGEWFTPANVGEKLSLRDFFTEARASGMIEGRGPAGFDERAKRAFANGLDQWIARKRS